MKREVIVGLVVVILVSTLLSMTLWIQNPRFLSNAERAELRATFHDVAGLRVGSKVWIYGTESGRVEGIEPDGKGSVEVRMTLDYDPGLRANAVVKIQPSSALGGAVVAIHPGTPDQPTLPPGIIAGVSQGDALGEIGRLAGDLRGPALETIENLRKITEDVASRSDSIIANLKNNFINSFAKLFL